MAGKDTTILAVLCYGGKGAVAATANVAPKLVSSIYEKFIEGDLTGALEAQYELAPLRMAFSLGTFPVIIKDALNIIGINVGEAVLPVKSISIEKMQTLRNILDGLKGKL